MYYFKYLPSDRSLSEGNLIMSLSLSVHESCFLSFFDASWFGIQNFSQWMLRNTIFSHSEGKMKYYTHWKGLRLSTLERDLGSILWGLLTQSNKPVEFMMYPVLSLQNFSDYFCLFRPWNTDGNHFQWSQVRYEEKGSGKMQKEEGYCTIDISCCVACTEYSLSLFFESILTHDIRVGIIRLT